MVELKSNSFERLNESEKHSDDIVRPAISYWADAWRRLKKNPVAILSLVILILSIFLSIFGPSFVEWDFTFQDYSVLDNPPNSTHWFGTDSLGRDLWARVWVGSRVSLTIGLVGTVIELGIGCLYGGLCGYLGGIVDTVLMRVLEVIATIPYLIIVILLLIVLPPGLGTLIFALCITGWTGIARMIRGQVMQLKNSEYVMAAKALGASPFRIIVKHLLPNTIGIIITYMSMDIPAFIFSEAFLSFLGMGIQAPGISLGVLVTIGQQNMTNHLYQLIVPAAVLFVMVLSFNILGDGLRDALDPKLRQ